MRTGQEEGAARNDSPDLTHAAGAEGALGKGAEFPPRPNCRTTLSFNYPKNPEERTLITPTSDLETEVHKTLPTVTKLVGGRAGIGILVRCTPRSVLPLLYQAEPASSS